MTRPEPIKEIAHRRWPLLAVFAACLLTAAIYWPSLSGGYIFDDYPNIVDNDAVHPTALDWHSLKRAAFSSPVRSTPRPIAMVSFAVDWYLHHGNPFFLKLTNLFIHLVNGFLVWLVVRQLVFFCNARKRPNAEATGETLALAVAALWLVAPINLTAVAYIVQRMESLAQLFVLGGLFTYLWIRTNREENGRSALMCGLALGAFCVIGYGAKETALLLPLYAFIAEAFVTGFRRHDGGIEKRMLTLFLLILLIPAIIGAAALLYRYIPSAAWANRSFTLTQRLLTEFRVIVDYIVWSLLPIPTQFHLYHDDIVLSRGWLNPATTLASALAIGCLAAFAIAVGRKMALIGIGIFWFLGAQLMTGTIIPLELVFEHRNYLASIGLYLVLFAALAHYVRSGHGRTRTAISALLVFAFAGATWLRAAEWSDPLTLALIEKQRSPDSPRIAYELGRTYVVLSGYKPDSPFVKLAFEELNRASQRNDASALPDQGLLILAARTHQPPPPGTWEHLRERLLEQPLSTEHIGAIEALATCASKGFCDFPTEKMVGLLAELLEKNPRQTRLLSIYAQYAANVLHDLAFAVELTREGLTIDPNDVQLHVNLIILLLAEGKNAEAHAAYAATLQQLPDARDEPSFAALGARLQSTTSPIKTGNP